MCNVYFVEERMIIIKLLGVLIGLKLLLKLNSLSNRLDIRIDEVRMIYERDYKSNNNWRTLKNISRGVLRKVRETVCLDCLWELDRCEKCLYKDLRKKGWMTPDMSEKEKREWKENILKMYELERKKKCKLK